MELAYKQVARYQNYVQAYMGDIATTVYFLGECIKNGTDVDLLGVTTREHMENLLRYAELLDTARNSLMFWQREAHKGGMNNDSL